MNSLTNLQKQIATSFEREARQVIIDRVSPSDFRYRKCESHIGMGGCVPKHRRARNPIRKRHGAPDGCNGVGGNQ